MPPSPAGDLVTLVAEALDGLGVIQAYNKQQYFTEVTSQCVDDAHRALFGAESLNLWLAFYCDFYGAAMVLAVACFGIGQWRELGSSNVGLAFSQSIQMLVFYTWSIRLLADTIGLFGSAEKLTWLANHTPQEGGRLQPPALRGCRRGYIPPPTTVGMPLPCAKVGDACRLLSGVRALGARCPSVCCSPAACELLAGTARFPVGHTGSVALASHRVWRLGLLERPLSAQCTGTPATSSSTQRAPSHIPSDPCPLPCRLATSRLAQCCPRAGPTAAPLCSTRWS